MKVHISRIIVGVWIVTGPLLAGTISGKIQNGTRGGKVEKPMTVQLYRYFQNEKDEDFVLTGEVNERGEFVFTDLPENPQIFYRPQVVYQGVKYSGTPVRVTAENPQAVSNLTIYETTSEDSALQVKYHHVLIQPGEGVVFVQEMMVVENRGDRVYVGKERSSRGTFRTLYFPLPHKAGNLQVDKGLMSCCIETAGDGFYDTMEFLPGRKEFVFSYQVEAPGKNLSLSRRFTLPTALFDIIPMDTRIRVAGNALQAVPIENTHLIRYTAENISPSREIQFTLTGLAGKPANLGLMFLIGFAGLLLVIGGAVFWQMKRRRSPDASSIHPTGTEEGIADSEKLIREIALLDEAFEAQQINAEEYRLRREQLKSRLEELYNTVASAR